METPLFTIKKEQRIKGEVAYTTAKLKARSGRRWNTRSRSTNSGRDDFKFGALKDTKCTNIKPSGSTDTESRGESETFTCEHMLVEADKPDLHECRPRSKVAESKKKKPRGHGYGKQPGTTCKIKESNTVEVEVNPKKALRSFSIHKEQRIAG